MVSLFLVIAWYLKDKATTDVLQVSFNHNYIWVIFLGVGVPCLSANFSPFTLGVKKILLGGGYPPSANDGFRDCSFLFPPSDNRTDLVSTQVWVESSSSYNVCLVKLRKNRKSTQDYLQPINVSWKILKV